MHLFICFASCLFLFRCAWRIFCCTCSPDCEAMGFLLQLRMSWLRALWTQGAGAGAGCCSWLCAWWRQGAGAGCRCWVQGAGAGRCQLAVYLPCGYDLSGIILLGCAHTFVRVNLYAQNHTVSSDVSVSILVCPRSWARECRALSRNIFCTLVLFGVYAGVI